MEQRPLSGTDTIDTQAQTAGTDVTHSRQATTGQLPGYTHMDDTGRNMENSNLDLLFVKVVKISFFLLFP